MSAPTPNGPDSPTGSEPAYDIYLSYARKDRPRVDAVARLLGSRGWSVFLDREMPTGVDFSQAIRDAQARCRVVLVLWTEGSLDTEFVHHEAQQALEADKYLPVRLDDIRVPPPFDQYHTLDLVGWDGSESHPAATKLLRDLESRFGREPEEANAPPSGAEEANAPPTPERASDSAAAERSSESESESAPEPSDKDAEAEDVLADLRRTVARWPIQRWAVAALFVVWGAFTVREMVVGPSVVRVTFGPVLHWAVRSELADVGDRTALRGDLDPYDAMSAWAMSGPHRLDEFQLVVAVVSGQARDTVAVLPHFRGETLVLGADSGLVADRVAAVQAPSTSLASQLQDGALPGAADHYLPPMEPDSLPVPNRYVGTTAAVEDLQLELTLLRVDWGTPRVVNTVRLQPGQECRSERVPNPSSGESVRLRMWDCFAWGGPAG